MTSQVEDDLQLQKEAELLAEEQRKKNENAMKDEAIKALNEKREKRQRGKQKKQDIMDEF